MGAVMKNYRWLILGSVAVATLAISQSVPTPPALLNLAEAPLFTQNTVPPLNMLVMGKDHKIYYEAYNDASDLDGNGSLDVGYRGWELRSPAPTAAGASPYKIDYYGYFNSFACYTWDGFKFVPQSGTTNKQCSGQWSGDFLNYLTTSRMDALRRVLYGGWRQSDTTGETVLQGAFFPQDAHSWGKEYKSTTRDGYDISQYAPLSAPAAGKYHLFAVTTVQDNTAPLFRVLQNTDARVWNWLSIEGPVAGNKCFNASNQRVDCVSTSTTSQPFPGHPGSRAAFDGMETTYAIAPNRYGSGTISNIDCNGNCNPHGADDEYLTIISGQINIRNNRGGTYQFRVDGDDVIDFRLAQQNGTQVAVAGCYNTAGRGFGACGGNESSAAVVLAESTNYNFQFRQEEGTGGDGYKLEWRKTSGGNNFDWRVITNNRADAGDNGSLTNTTLTTYDLTPLTTGGSRRDDYAVRVLTCPSATPAAREATCKAYPNGGTPIYKPTGILHDYGETQKMYFGLITGSQRNNLEGGVLRKNVSNFADEIVPATGIFRTNVDGIARTIDSFRMIGGSYNSGASNNLTGDSNWSWNGNNGDCDAGTIGGNPLTNGNCRMWGNPIAEMMYESLRYFAGAGAATARFATGGGANGGNEETTMGLTTAAWKDPYAATTASPGGLGYATCAKPFQTVISDINPSYDGDLPGSGFSGAITTVSNTPGAISGFSASGQGQAIWDHEFAGPKSVFIGEVAGVTDGAPSAKLASTFGNIRGLSPEEPTKGGSYYAASVARYGRITDINAAAKAQNLSTYAVALASPLPRIEFPVGTTTVTLLPFAKTASGTFGTGTKKPTNTIVDFYVEQIVNLPGQPFDATVNGGRPSAIFRINYEDVEQGNDHDMDAIVRYEVKANAAGTLTVNLTSEYAAGSADQNIGYVISGTTADGIYLEVRDTDSGAGSFLRYDFNTPPGIAPGGCKNVTTGACNQQLPTTATRTFTPSTTSSNIVQLKDPLWYAAKYGGFVDADGDNLPQGTEWDSDSDGVPDKYFLVTNPLQLRAQLKKAFDAIQNQADQPSGSQGLAGARISAGSFVVEPSFSALAGGKDWVGNLKAFRVNNVGTGGAELWNAAANMPTTPGQVNSRKIFTALGDVIDTNRAARVTEFRATNLSPVNNSTEEMFNQVGYTSAQVINLFGAATTPQQLVDYLRGDKTLEGGTKGVLPFRTRSSILGDIINSSPEIAAAKDDYGWAYASGLSSTVRDGYKTYLTTNGPAGKKNRASFVYVGANDGMLHAFNGSTQPCTLTDGTASVCNTADSGKEVFAYVPNAVLGRTGLLADPDYDHRYYVDGGIAVADVHDGTAWKTVLAGASGVGGKGVFGLDISNPSAFAAADVLWEVNGTTPVHGADVGHVLSAPVIAPLDNGSWVALFGNGYNSVNGTAALFVVDVRTGVVLKKLSVTDGVNTSNGIGDIAAIDSDDDGLVDTVYGGDLHGNVWKFDLNAAASSSWNVAFSGNPLFVAKDGAGVRQPITGGIEVSSGPGLGLSVFFGTGSYFQNGDHATTAGQQVQSLYSIWDNGTAITAARDAAVGGLQVQSITDEPTGTPGTRKTTLDTVDYFSKRGWYLDLRFGTTSATAVGERFIGTPRLQNGKVFFTTYVPLGDSCTPGGRNWLFSLNAITGAAAMSQVSLSPDGNPPVCTGADCAAIALTDGAPVRDTNVLVPPPVALPGLAGGCVPGTPGCPIPTTPTFERCTIVIRASGAPPLYLPRPCGRQSWRQVR